ncbi:MAG: efflux RND transporter periplasmic adaptor subunit [Thermoanaerobaculia bacterium]
MAAGVPVLVTALGCTRATSQPAPAEIAAMPAQAVRGDLVVRVLLTGELVAEDAVLLVAPNVNIWPLQLRWLAEDGAEVAAGERVVEFDSSQLTSNLEELRVQRISAATKLTSLQSKTAAEEAQAEFELEQSRGNLEKARLEVAAARLMAPIEQQRRELDLRRAELELEKARLELESTKASHRAEIEIQRIAREKARAKVTRAETGIDELTLRARREGILIVDEDRREGRAYQIGDSVWPGRTVARLPDLETLIVEARVFDVDDGRVVPGMPVRATLDAFPGEVFTGRVRQIDRIARDSSFRSQRRFFFTRVDLDDVDPERMRPGMSVKIEIETVHEDVLWVPRTSLDWSAGGARVRLAGGGWQTVTLGPCNAAVCAIEDGLAESTALGSVTERGRS